MLFSDNYPTISPRDIAKAVQIAVRSKVTIMLHGHPSTAKTSVARQVAAQFNLYYIDVRLGQCQPEDLLGFPRINPNTGKAEYIPFGFLPLEGDPIPDGYDGWMVGMDEFNAVPDDATEAAAYKVTNEREVGQYKLHPNVAIVCMGNLVTSNAIARDMSSASVSRMRHYLVKPDSDSFRTHAREVLQFDKRIQSYLEFKPEHVYTFDPDQGTQAYSCNRTWEHTNDSLKELESLVDDIATSDFAFATFAGSLGEGVARSFQGFLRYFNELPDIQSILKNPESAIVPTEPGARWALASSLPEHANEDTLASIVTYADRMPPELALMTFKDLVARKRPLIKHPALSSWRTRFAKDMVA